MRLGVRLCSAVEPISQVEAITGNAGPGTVVTVERFRDANGEPFGWITYSGRNVTSEWRLLWEQQAREGRCPRPVAAELAGATSVPAPVPAVLQASDAFTYPCGLR